jgi:hypothetical protein
MVLGIEVFYLNFLLSTSRLCGFAKSLLMGKVEAGTVENTKGHRLIAPTPDHPFFTLDRTYILFYSVYT